MAIIHYSVGYYFKTALTQLAPKFNFFICHYSTFDFNRTRQVFYNRRKKMRCYLSNGIKARQFKEDDFSVTKWVSSDGMESYSFTGDEIFYEIDDLCVNLYDRLAEAIFDLEEYRRNLSFEPIWLRESGIDSEVVISKEKYEKYLQVTLYERNVGEDEILKFISETAKPFQPISRYIYLYDLQVLLGYIQNNIISIRQSVADFYIALAEYSVLIRDIEDTDEHCFFGSGQTSVKVFKALNSIIITIVSTFDLISKLTNEVQQIPQNFESRILKLKSGKIIFNYGQNDRIVMNLDTKNTIFEQSRIIKMVVELRNELIHNSTWQSVNKIYVRYKDREIIEKFILIPDIDENGQIIRSGSRNHFFSQENKINEMLPQILDEIMLRILQTLYNINVEIQNSSKETGN